MTCAPGRAVRASRSAVGRTLLTSSSAELRLGRAEAWPAGRAADEELLLVGGIVDGVYDLGRRAGLKMSGTFGRHRLTLRRLALRLAER